MGMPSGNTMTDCQKRRDSGWVLQYSCVMAGYI